MRKSTLSNRLEIRVDSSLNKTLERFCKEHHVKQSEALREAVSLYLECGSLKNILMDSLRNDHSFWESFREFLKNCPMPVAVFFENYLGMEEEKIAESLPLNMSGWEGVFITSRGKKAFLKRREAGK